MVILVAAQAAGVQAQSYTVETFSVPEPKGNGTYALGLNDRGDVVGNYAYTLSGVFYNYGFERHADGSFTYPITGPDGAEQTWATGVNGSGEIVGFYNLGQAPIDGFTLVEGVYASIDLTQDGGVTEIRGINESGDYAGAFERLGQTTFTGFISSGGVVADVSVPGSTQTRVSGITRDGATVGTAVVNDQYVSFLRGKDGKIRTFRIGTGSGFLNGTYATGINSGAGLIVGYYYDPQGLVHGFVYRYRALGEGVPASVGSDGAAPIEGIVAETVSASVDSDTYVQGVNASGALVGTWQHHSSSGVGLPFGFIATPVK